MQLLREERVSRGPGNSGRVGLRTHPLAEKGVLGPGPGCESQKSHSHVGALLSGVRIVGSHKVLQGVLSQKGEDGRMTWPQT